MKVEVWKVGREGTVVTDTPEGFIESTGHIGEDAIKYYGGFLVCESIWKPNHAKLIAAAPDMLEALMSIENDDGAIPDSIWNLRNEAIKKATE